MEHLQKKLADKLVEIALKQFESGFNFKKVRMEDIRENEEFYYGRKVKVPKGRIFIPLPVMSGFVDHLMSKIDDPPVITYNYTDLADLKIAMKTSAAWQKESHPTRENWPQKDRWAKKLACFSGRAIYKIFAESDPRYKSHLEVVDYEDFVCEPMGGGDLEKHLFCGQDNIFRTKDQLLKNARSGLYDSAQVRKLIRDTGDETLEKNKDIYSGKRERLAQLGLNLESNTYHGQPIFRFIEWVMDYNGEKYYLLFDWFTKNWVRAHKLKDIFESNLIPWESWATHEDAFVFWSKAPCDDVRPAADSIDTLFSQVIENRNKKNLGQRAYDPDIFPDPSELEWRPNGLVRATAMKKNKTISQGIYEFQVGDITNTIDLVTFMDNFIGRKTGITPEAEGALEKDQKVGIYFGSLQQIADRLGLYNKSYRESWERLGLKYAWGLHDHMNEKMSVKIIGEQGVEWEDLVRGEAKKAPDFDIDIEGGSAEIMANEAKSKKRENSLMLLVKRPELGQQLNPNWLVQEILRQGQWEEEQIRIAMSRETTNLELLSEASQAIQMILKGKAPKINRGADTSFIQKIIDFAIDKDLKMDIYTKMMAYAQAHMEIAVRNMTRKAVMIQAGQGVETEEKPKSMMPISEETMVEEPILGTPGAGISQGLKASNILRGK